MWFEIRMRKNAANAQTCLGGLGNPPDMSGRRTQHNATQRNATQYTMNANTLSVLQDVVADMDVVSNELLSPSTPTMQVELPAPSIHVKRVLQRIAILAGEAGTAFDGNILTGRGAREDFTRLIGSPDGMFCLLNYRTHKVRLRCGAT